MGDEEDQGKSGVSAAAPAALFEMADDDERALEEANPFRVRRGGSRKGVPNRRTEDFKRYYQSLGLADPLIFLGHVVSKKTDDLAREIGCKPVEALDMQRRAAGELAPYLHSKQPARVDIGDGEALPMLVIGKAERAEVRRAVQAGAMSIDGDIGDDEENQSVAAGDASGSHGEGSHGSGEGE